MTRWLARYLGVAIGDTVVVDLLEQGSRRVGLVVAGTYDPMVGQGIYMSRTALNRLLREPNLASGSYLSIAPRRDDDVMSRLREFPGIVGVVYNSARIALSERGRELASLRVLGFTTGEVSRMLLGEQGAVMLVALPLGIAFGAAFSLALVLGFQTERFRFPFVMALGSQLLAVAVVLGAAALAGLVVHRRIGRLDMVAALRTRE
jgi:putative ABC transport system permease protein